MNRPAPSQLLTAGLLDRRSFRVGAATVDPVSRDATWTGGQERLQPQTLKVLLTLVSRRGEVVTRDELVQLCWDGRIVGDDVINRSILLLRHFADRAGGFAIETVPRAGYRLVEGDGLATSIRKRRRIGAAAATAIIAVAGLAGWWWLDRRPPSQGLPPTPSISVAPFVAEANDPLTRQVAQAAPVSISHMMAESGFAIVRDDPGGNQPARTDYLFSGNIRHVATSIEATVQLVSRRDGTILYTHDFTAPVDKAADLPDRIGAATAAELAWTGAEMLLDPREHLRPEIASELMNALIETIEGHDRLRAYQLTRHAAASAPNSAMAQLSLAAVTGFGLGTIPRGERDDALALGRRASDEARALAPEFGDVYLTWCELHSPVLMTQCDARVRHALKVDPRSSFVPGYLSSLLYEAGRIDESIQLANQSMANDPYKPAKLARMIRMLEVSGRSSEAEQVYRDAMRLWPDNSRRLRASRLLGMAERGNYGGVAAFADPATDGPMIDPPAFAALMAALQKRDSAGVERACATDDLSDFTLSLCMTILADFGDLDRSYAIAARLYPAWPRSEPDADRFWLDHLDGYSTSILAGPAGRSMRADHRFLALAASQGLLSYWRADGLPDFCRASQPEPICQQLRAR